jgi:hypothetical protein
LSSSAQVTITAAPTATNTPSILWNQPGAIEYGTPLSTQLDATASVPGALSTHQLPGACSKLEPRRSRRRSRRQTRPTTLQR